MKGSCTASALLALCAAAMVSTTTHAAVMSIKYFFPSFDSISSLTQIPNDGECNGDLILTVEVFGYYGKCSNLPLLPLGSIAFRSVVHSESAPVGARAAIYIRVCTARVNCNPRCEYPKIRDLRAEMERANVVLLRQEVVNSRMPASIVLRYGGPE